MKKVALTLAVAAVLSSGCANRPESIRASHVSHEKYSHFDCIQLATRMGDMRAELEKYSQLQDSNANGDAVGVFLVLSPVSKLTGDHEGDVARYKGEIEAVETAQIKMKCKNI